MGRVCSICSHDEHHSIKAALEQGTSTRTIAHQYDVSRYALMRHARDHLPGKMLREAEVRAAPHAPAHEGKMLREDKVQAAPHAWAREPHQGKMLTLANIPAAPTRVRVRASTGRATRLRIREHLQAEYGPQLAALGRELDALQGEIEAFKRELQAERKRRAEAAGSGTTPAVPVPRPETEQRRMWGI